MNEIIIKLDEVEAKYLLEVIEFFVNIASQADKNNLAVEPMRNVVEKVKEAQLKT